MYTFSFPQELVQLADEAESLVTQLLDLCSVLATRTTVQQHMEVLKRADVFLPKLMERRVDLQNSGVKPRLASEDECTCLCDQFLSTYVQAAMSVSIFFVATLFADFRGFISHPDTCFLPPYMEELKSYYGFQAWHGIVRGSAHAECDSKGIHALPSY